MHSPFSTVCLLLHMSAFLLLITQRDILRPLNATYPSSLPNPTAPGSLKTPHHLFVPSQSKSATLHIAILVFPTPPKIPVFKTQQQGYLGRTLTFLDDNVFPVFVLISFLPERSYFLLCTPSQLLRHPFLPCHASPILLNHHSHSTPFHFLFNIPRSISHSTPKCIPSSPTKGSISLSL